MALGPLVTLAKGLCIPCMMLSPPHSCLLGLQEAEQAGALPKQSGCCRSYWKLPLLPGKVNEVPATPELRIPSPLKKQPSVLIVIIHDNYDYCLRSRDLYFPLFVVL